MAQYFRPRRAPSSATPDNHVQALSSNGRWYRNGPDVDIDNRMASSSILVFPSPPSERESLRSAGESQFQFSGSTPSLPTEMSLDSVRSTSRSRSRGGEARSESQRNWQNISQVLPHDRGWGHHQLLEESSEWELDNEYIRPDTTRYTSLSPQARSGGHTRISSSISSPLIGSLPLSPQPPFRLPFLSFLQSFLSLDDSTLHLISRSPDPHTSDLFLVPPGSHLPPEGDEEPLHGAVRLLSHNPDKPKNTSLLKAGMDPSEVSAEANPFLMSPTQIPVWRLVEFVIEGGVKAWKEVRGWDTNEARLMGV